jgi:hypothetical protein
MTNQTGKRRRRSPYREWAKAALITALVMGTLWILLLTAPWFFGNSDAVGNVFFLALMFPGAFIALPAVLAQGPHNAGPGWFVMGGILNWLLYSQLVYELMRFRIRRLEAGLPPLEPEVFDYRSRWQKPAR